MEGYIRSLERWGDSSHPGQQEVRELRKGLYEYGQDSGQTMFCLPPLETSAAVRMAARNELCMVMSGGVCSVSPNYGLIM